MKIVPLTLAQEALWLRLVPGSPIFNVPYACSLTGPLDVEALCKAVKLVVSRHDALRAAFPITDDGGPVQIVHDRIDVPCTVTTLTAPLEYSDVRALIEQEAFTLFDLEHGPLIRARLFALDRMHHVFVLTVHHLLFDDWSTPILFDELSIAYNAYTSNEEPHLNDPVGSYAKWALEQRESLAGGRLEDLAAFWKRYLKGARNILEGGKGGRTGLPIERERTQLISGELLTGLRGLARSERITMFALVLAAYKIALALETQEQDVVVVFPMSVRPRPDLEHSIGFFNNRLLVRTWLDRDLSIRSALKRVAGSLLDVMDNDEVPYRLLASTVGLNNIRSLWRVQIEHHRVPAAPGIQLAGIESTYGGVSRDEATQTKFDVALSVGEHLDRMELLWHPCGLDKSRPELVPALMQALWRTMELMVREPDRPLSAAR